MSFRQLRSLHRGEISWQRVLAGWRAHDIDVSLAVPAPAGRHMAVNADHGVWRALIDPREWLCHELPELAVMAGTACDDEKIMALFNSRSRPLAFAHHALTYRLLRAESLVLPGDVPDGLLPRLSARECTVWVTGITDSLMMKPQTAGTCLLAMPLAVEWLIGASGLPGGLAAKLSVGDVLLINEAKHQLRCQGVTIGTYWQNEEMIMINEYDKDTDMPEGHHPQPAAAALIPNALTPVPLKVEFILQRRYLTIGELQHLFKGKVLEIDPAREKNIEIRANGHLLASGELVQLEDRLGVEISALHMDMLHDK